MIKAPSIGSSQSRVHLGRRRLGAVFTGLALAVAVSLPLTAMPGEAAEAAGVNDQHAYVAFVQDSSSTRNYVRSEAERLAVIDRALQRWQTDSAGAISSFTRAGGVANLTVDCTSSNVVYDAWAQAGQAFPGVDFSTSTASRNHFLVVAPPNCGSGLGYNGNRAVGLNAGGSVFVTDEPSYGIHSILHELGHNFSLSHAYSDYCNTTRGCGPKNYENRYEVMGYTLDNFTPGSIGTYTRDWLGITQRCEAPVVGLADGQRTATATYDLLGRGQQEGTRGLKITAADGKVYFVDFRNHTGLDSEAYYGSDPRAFGVYGPGVTVNTAATVNGSVVPSLQTRPKNPADPTGGYYGYFEPGAPFAANGVEVKIDSVSASTAADATAQVTVTLTNPAGTTDAPLPVQQGDVTVQGTPAVGETLYAAPSAWTTGSCYRYQWFDNGVAIDGARAATYTPADEQDGHRITVAVTGQQTGYQPRTVTSAELLIGGDKTAPTTSIDSKPDTGSTNTTPSFTFSANEASTFECSVDGAVYTACESPFTTAKLARGAHTFSVRAIDASGNIDPTPAQTEFTIAVPALTVAVGTETVLQGEDQTATGSGFEAGEVVSGVMASEPIDLGTQTADADGQVTFTWTVPTSTDVGRHTVTLTGTESGSVAAEFDVASAVVAPTPPSGGGTGGSPGEGAATASTTTTDFRSGEALAFTGANIINAGILALLLLAAGGAGLFVARRRMAALRSAKED